MAWPPDADCERGRHVAVLQRRLHLRPGPLRPANLRGFGFWCFGHNPVRGPRTTALLRAAAAAAAAAVAAVAVVAAETARMWSV